jgi:hypothetical protein
MEVRRWGRFSSVEVESMGGRFWRSLTISSAVHTIFGIYLVCIAIETNFTLAKDFKAG